MRHVFTLLLVCVVSDFAFPLAVSSQSPKVTSVAIGYGHACATTSDGALYCWGENGFGQLGIGTKKDQLTPARVSTAASIVEVVVGGSRSKQAGFFSCALATDGQVFCWGSNGLGQLGDGARKDQRTPVPVAGGVKFTDLRAGKATVCGLNGERRLYCWGAVGEIGVGLGPSRAVHAVTRPTEIVLPGAAKADSLIADAVGDPCVLGDDGAAYCWTAEGSELRVERVTPPERSFRSVELSGFTRKCGITRADELLCWSDVASGGRIELSLRAMSGRTTSGDFGRFEMPAHGTSFRDLIRADGTCALSVDGKVLCATGTVMAAAEMPALKAEAEGHSFAALRFRGSDRCALTTAGEVYCWTPSERSPIRVGAGSTFTTLTAHGSNACAITADGALWCWGENASGQVGDGTRKPRPDAFAVAVQ